MKRKKTFFFIFGLNFFKIISANEERKFIKN